MRTMHEIQIGETKFAPANLRIQKREDIIKIGGFKAIRNHNESIMFARAIRRILKKKIGRTTIASGMIAKHWQRDPNKGYPKNFKKYFTYDARHN